MSDRHDQTGQSVPLHISSASKDPHMTLSTQEPPAPILSSSAHSMNRSTCETVATGPPRVVRNTTRKLIAVCIGLPLHCARVALRAYPRSVRGVTRLSKMALHCSSLL